MRIPEKLEAYNKLISEVEEFSQELIKKYDHVDAFVAIIIFRTFVVKKIGEMFRKFIYEEVKENGENEKQ